MAAEAAYRTVLAASLFLIVTGLLLTTFSLFSPSWQVAEIAELHVTHQHGLWWDCVVDSGELISLRDDNPMRGGTRCSYKFDPATENALRKALDQKDPVSRELLLHRFLPQHKAVVFFAVFTFIFGIIGAVIGLCSPCFPPNSLLYVVALFMTTSCSVLADVIFIFASMRVDTRSVPGIVGNYQASTSDEGEGRFFLQNRLGIAAYVHVVASCILGLALLASVVAASLLISKGSRVDGRDDCALCCPRETPFEDPYSPWREHGSLNVRRCSRQHCKPFIAVNTDESSA